MAVRNMGMAVKRRGGLAFSGIAQQHIQPLLDHMPVSVGHKKIHPVNFLGQYFLHKRRAAIPVTVAGQLDDGNIRIFLRHSTGIVVIIAQMDNPVGLYCLNAPAHIAQTAMGIR